MFEHIRFQTKLHVGEVYVVTGGFKRLSRKYGWRQLVALQVFNDSNQLYTC